MLLCYPLPSALWDGKENPHSYADIPNPWDRMRWCRYSLGLLQKEVAAMVGMEEWLYQDLDGNFSPAKRKSSSASHDMWQRRRAFVMESFSIILIFALTYMAFRKTRSRSSNVAFHAGCSENTVCST